MNTFLKSIKQTFFCAAISFGMLTATLATHAQDWKSLMTKAGDAYEAKKYDETIDLATQAWALTKTPLQKYLTAAYRVIAIEDEYLFKGGIYSSNEFSIKYDAATIEKINLGIRDSLFVIDYLNNDPAATAENKKLKGGYYFRLGKFYVFLANRATHNPADYANAEKNLRTAATIGVESGEPLANLPRSLAGQGKLDEARREHLRRLAPGDKDYESNAVVAIDDFDFVGELLLGDAFLLEAAGKLKAAGKPLGDLQRAVSNHQSNLKDVAQFPNPSTAFEINRQGALLYLTKQPEKAAQSFIKVAEISGNLTAKRWLTMLNLQQKSYPIAENLAAKILAANPNDVIGLTARGFIAAARKNDFARAEKDLKAAIDVYPEAALFANTFQALAFIYQKQNKTAELNDILARQKSLADLYAEVKNLRPKSFADEMLDKRPIRDR